MSGPLLVILGPTGAGKSALALMLAEELGGEIISADAMQVYRGLDIGTAKPSAAERARVPHHLLDLFEPQQRCSAGTWAELARAAIADIRGRGRLPLVAGGTGLYVRALLQGLAPVPARLESARGRLERLAQRRGPERLHRLLRRLDPAGAARLPVGDRQRVLRALEVRLATGRPLREHIERAPFAGDREPALKIGLHWPPVLLVRRIEQRVDRQLEAGWLEEVRGLLEQGVPTSAHAFKALGYRTLALQLAGVIDRAEARERIQRDTRRLAKRQRTWFRSEREVVWFDASEPLWYDRVRRHVLASLAVTSRA